MITKFTAPVNIDILAKYDNIYSALLRVRVALQNKVFLTKVRCEMDAMGFVFVLAFTCLFVCIIFFFCEIKCHKENLPLGASIVAIVLLGIHTGFLKDEVRDQQRQIDQLCKVIPLAMATDRTVGNDEHCTYGKLPKGVYTFCFADYKDGSAEREIGRAHV